MNELRSIIDDALRRLSPKSNMAKALSYGRKRWDELMPWNWYPSEQDVAQAA